ncbi:MAG: TetR/AcrR family transcriptional regulator [Dehalococcoidia bacterium]
MAKTDRGAAVIDKVLEAAQALLVAKPIRAISVVEISEQAGIARASLLLQFPGGLSDIVAAVSNREGPRVFELEGQLCRKNPPQTPLESVEPLVEALVRRVEATGMLYRNLLAESFQAPTGTISAINDDIGFFGVTLILRAVADHPADKTVLDAGTMAMAEVLGRCLWSAAVGTFVQDRAAAWPGTEQAGDVVAQLMAQAVAPVLRQRTLKNVPLLRKERKGGGKRG